jgi:hypothetical protein
VKVIDDEAGYRFMTFGDANGDGRLDLVRAGKKIDIFLRTDDKGVPAYKKSQIAQPTQPKSVKAEAKPKGVALMELNGDLTEHPRQLAPVLLVGSTPELKLRHRWFRKSLHPRGRFWGGD